MGRTDERLKKATEQREEKESGKENCGERNVESKTKSDKETRHVCSFIYNDQWFSVVFCTLENPFCKMVVFSPFFPFCVRSPLTLPSALCRARVQQQLSDENFQTVVVQFCNLCFNSLPRSERCRVADGGLEHEHDSCGAMAVDLELVFELIVHAKHCEKCVNVI